MAFDTRAVWSCVMRPLGVERELFLVGKVTHDLDACLAAEAAGCGHSGAGDSPWCCSPSLSNPNVRHWSTGVA